MARNDVAVWEALCKKVTNNEIEYGTENKSCFYAYGSKLGVYMLYHRLKDGEISYDNYRHEKWRLKINYYPTEFMNEDDKEYLEAHPQLHYKRGFVVFSKNRVTGKTELIGICKQFYKAVKERRSWQSELERKNPNIEVEYVDVHNLDRMWETHNHG